MNSLDNSHGLAEPPTAAANVDLPPMAEEDKAVLDGLFANNKPLPSSMSFESMLYKLLVFRCVHEHCRVPTSEYPLGTWVQYLRHCHADRSKNPSYLTPERIRILDSLGFTWSLQQSNYDRRWAANFALLLEYKSQHGHCRVPQAGKLGKWVQMQRDQYRERHALAAGLAPNKRRSALSDDRYRQLQSVGFAWQVVPERVGWEGRYAELKEYRKAYGHTNVPQGWKANIALGRWVMKQRVQYHKLQRGQPSQMTQERIAKLEQIDFAWVGAGRVGGMGGNKKEV